MTYVKFSPPRVRGGAGGGVLGTFARGLYVTNAQGEKVGVLLNLETYQQLTNLSIDSELLIALNQDELQALAESSLQQFPLL